MARVGRKPNLDEAYYAGKISVEEFVERILKENAFDQDRRKIVKVAKKSIRRKPHSKPAYAN